MCLCIHQSVHICTPMEDRGQLPGVGSLILPCDPGDHTQVVRFGGECLYLGLGLLRSNLMMMICFFLFFPPRPFFHFLSCLKSFNFMHCLCVCGVLVVLPYHFSPYSFEAEFLTAPGLRVKASKPWQFFHLCPLWLWRTGVHALTFEFLHACWDSNPDPRVCTLCTLTH